MKYQTETRYRTVSKWNAAALVTTLFAGSVFAQTPAGDRAAREILLEDIPFFTDSPIACDGHPLDGVLASATITVRGVEQNAGFNQVWVDNAGGQHLLQIAPHLSMSVIDETGTYSWQGVGRGRYLWQAGGGNGTHFGGVIMFAQDEYYEADGDYPDLFWSVDQMLVIDAKGNVRRDRFSSSGADVVCVAE